MAAAALAARRFAGTSTRRGPSPYWRCGGETASSDEEGDENDIGGIAKAARARARRATHDRTKWFAPSERAREVTAK